MTSNKGGVALVVVILLVVSISFAYVLTSPTGGGLKYSNSPTKNTQYYNLGADAAGWEYNNNASIRNPVLNVQTSTLVYFNVTEIDGAPHNLYIAFDGAYTSSLFTKLSAEQVKSPKSIEGSDNYQVLSTSQITQTVGHHTQGKFPFFTAGIYTYWCSIHFLTMVGLLIVNSTSASSSVVASGVHAGITPQNVVNMPLTYVTSAFNQYNTLDAVNLV